MMIGIKRCELAVFIYRVLRKYLNMIGFTEVHGYGFGLYPCNRLAHVSFSSIYADCIAKINPYHCHQMVLVARK